MTSSVVFMTSQIRHMTLMTLATKTIVLAWVCSWRYGDFLHESRPIPSVYHGELVTRSFGLSLRTSCNQW